MADVEALVAALTTDEKIALLSGADFWTTVAVERLGIPSIAVTDGPSGARGATFPGAGGDPSTCIPCGSAMGATWDPELAEEVGALVGREARDRGCRALLAPTVNLHRAVLAGRNFECYSEDPLLSGRLAAGFVRGVQSAGVIATVKHFVGNEAEFERTTISSVIDERALRELYLLPFELAVREGGALGIMTSYNRLNGRWLTQRPELLLALLRDEWGFEGLVMTDWLAVAEPASVAAGLELEMPGPARALGVALAAAVETGEVAPAALDDAVRRFLGAWDRAGALDAPTPVSIRPPGDAEVALVRRAAAAGTVLLRNDGVLPLDIGALARIALIGPNADAPRIMGGGSSEVTPYQVVTPLEALRAALPGHVALAYERGCDIDRTARPVGGPGLRAPDGFTLDLFAGLSWEGAPVERRSVQELRTLFLGDPSPGLAAGDWSLRAKGTVVAAETGEHELGLVQCGRCRVLVDGAVVLDGFADPPPPGGTEFFGFASQEAVATIMLTAGVPAEVVVELAAIDAPFLAGMSVGFRPPARPDLFERAVDAAAEADVAVVVVGTSREWESEMRDRSSFSLPGRQDELVRAVAAVNPRTVVVVNAGSVVDLPWADDVAAVLQCWFGGQELGGALADVLTGATEPGGRLATTIPVRVEHSPSWDNFPGENGEVRYGEGVFMGYRGHDHRCIPPRFPFGHGLGYTTFSLGAPVAPASFRPGGTCTVTVPVTNTGDREGTAVVQCYVAPRGARLARPPKELKAFAKVVVAAGDTVHVDLVLDDRSFAYWDPGQADWAEIEPRVADLTGASPTPPQERRAPGWQVDPGTYELLVGFSSADLPASATLVVEGGAS
jgi:beta-glucosidase